MKMKRSSRWPFRQADPTWRSELMWDRAKVIEVHRNYNGASRQQAEGLLEERESGNSIAEEGCLLCCMAMVLRLLAPQGKRWTPLSLHRKANDGLFYTKAGLSMVTFYSDLVADASKGEVQSFLQEQYFAGETGWKPVFASESTIVRGYRSLGAAARNTFAIVLKIGTHDDSFASHFVVLDPDDPGDLDDDNPVVLDPVQPAKVAVHKWTISRSYRYLAGDAGIRKAWRQSGIRSPRISGVWAFARWKKDAHSLGANLLAAVAQEAEVLSRKS